jgi:hypothetical protein
MDSRLNFFFPYERAPAWHENQLTRALLVVLRYSPMAHQIWLRMVAPGHTLQDLPKAEFATQRQRVLESGATPSDGEAVTGISVWLAPDAAPISEAMSPSERQQVLDGVITYGDALVVVVENKIRIGGVTEQPHRINLHGAPVVWNDVPAAVDWQTLLAAFSDLIERSLVSGAEQLLVADFLELVEAYFPRIGPYSTLARCGSQPFRLERRLDTVLGKAVDIPDTPEAGRRDLSGTDKIAMAYLKYSPKESSVCLRMYPADTLRQSRDLYGDRAAVEAVLALRNDGWQVDPNFHWGFMAKGFAWANTPCSLEEYCTFWVKEIGKTVELPRTEWNSYWARLESARIVEPAGKQQFDVDFTASQRTKAHPRPGLSCEFVWPLVEAQNLDSKGQFIMAVRTRLNEMLAALGAPIIDDNRKLG